MITSLKSLFASKVWAAVNLGGRHSARFRRPPPAGHTALPSGPLVAVSRGPLRALSLGQQPRIPPLRCRCCFPDLAPGMLLFLFVFCLFC